MRRFLRGWRPTFIAVGALIIASVALGGTWLYRWMELRRVEQELEILRRAVQTERTTNDTLLAALCPSIVDLDPLRTNASPWGPGVEEAKRLLPGGRAEVRVAAPDADPSGGPRARWREDLEVYELDVEEIPTPGAFHFAVRVSEDRWVRAVPSNWSPPLCEPWIDCSGGGCEGECLEHWAPEMGIPPPASIPLPCRFDGD